ncbi:MAG: hypothetical protein ACF8QF_01055 [Phycisphaerales bacterium]
MSRMLCTGFALAAAVVVVPAAEGAFSLQDLDIRIVRPDGTMWNIQNGNNLENSITEFRQVGEFQFVVKGSFSETGWSCDWDLLIDEDPFVNANFAFTNNTGSDNNFQVIVGANVQPVSPSSVMQGSISGTLGSGVPGTNTATLAAASGDSLYTALVDGVGVQTLLNDPFSVSTAFTTAFGAADFGIPSPIAGPAVVNSIGIRHSFFLTAGDSATFSSAFVVNVPTPGTVALMGLAGIVSLRRRR